jgi:hypothetical protein
VKFVFEHPGLACDIQERSRVYVDQ